MNRTIAIFIITLFFFAVSVSVVTTNLSVMVPTWYLVLSITTFLAYLIDKSASRKGRWRTSEKALHALGLLGGWPGALLAQQILRHKNRKRSFLVIFSFTVLLNCAALIWLHTPEGRLNLDSVTSKIQDIAANDSFAMLCLSRRQDWLTVRQAKATFLFTLSGQPRNGRNKRLLNTHQSILCTAT